MKKIVNISISAIIFYIENDAYDTLRHYLDETYAHFASHENGSEIIADIESRIAEIFLSKGESKKKAITMEEVTGVMKTIGNIDDFKQDEQHYNPNATKESNESQEGSSKKTGTFNFNKLYRNEKEKMIGGVCAGFGDCLSIDPIWTRLLFVLLVFSSLGIAVVIYIILWIVLPPKYEKEKKTKKLFRDINHKIIGGVASGIAAFLDTDVVLIRILFIAFMLAGGSGIIVYLVLWILMPKGNPRHVAF